MTSATQQQPKMKAGKLSDVARHVVLPDGIVSTGWPAVRNTCNQLGITFDEWQDGAGRALLAKRADGLYASDTAVISIPRQVGKTFLLGSIAFALCIITPGTLVIWTAHRFKTARETFMSLKGMAVRPSMVPHVNPDDIYSGSGNESIGFRNGSRIMFGARERGFGRGFSKVAILVLDEAQILSSTAMEDMVPTTNASPNPLILLTGTPPRPNDPSEVFSTLRSEALAGDTEDTLYIELSADPDADPMDREQWAKANPSYPERTSARAILRMKKNLTSESFLREGLGIWDDDAADRRPIPFDLWESLSSEDKPTGQPAFFVTISKDLRAACIGVAVMNAGVPHVEVDWRPGTTWLSDRVAELHKRYPRAAFGAYSAGPVKAWVPKFAEFGVDVQMLTRGDEAAACGHLQKLAESLGFTHAPDEVVTESLLGAEKRDMDGGAWVWDWRNSASDLAPIAAETGALWLLESRKPGVVNLW